VFTLRSERLDGSLDMRPIVSDSAVFLISVVLGCATTRNAPLPAISYFHELSVSIARAWSGLPSFRSSSMCPSSESDFKWGEERRGWGRGGDSESKVAEPG
jgi:hypothetical protein